jgi:L-asparaginase
LNPQPAPPPQVTVISLGGTIASSPQADSAFAGPRLGAADLVSSVPQLSEVATVTVRDVLRVPSCDLTLDHAIVVAREIRAAASGGAHGVVVTQGTDTIEEMSFCLDLLLADDDTPVVVTGAMRHAGLPGNDGPANLLDAVRVAASDAACGLGCLVVLNEEVHAAAAVRKMHTSSPAAFRSPSVGPIGWLVEGVPRLRDRPFPRVLVRPEEGRLPPVALVKIAIGDDGWWIDPVRSHAAGLVVEGMGGGHLPGWLVQRLEPLAREMPVVLTSRTGDGEVLTSTYGGFPGSESSLIDAGLIPGRMLPALKARVLIALVLAAGGGRPQVEEAVDRLGRPRQRARGGSSTPDSEPQQDGRG